MIEGLYLISTCRCKVIVTILLMTGSSRFGRCIILLFALLPRDPVRVVFIMTNASTNSINLETMLLLWWNRRGSLIILVCSFICNSIDLIFSESKGNSNTHQQRGTCGEVAFQHIWQSCLFYGSLWRSSCPVWKTVFGGIQVPSR